MKQPILFDTNIYDNNKIYCIVKIHNEINKPDGLYLFRQDNIFNTPPQLQEQSADLIKFNEKMDYSNSLIKAFKSKDEKSPRQTIIFIALYDRDSKTSHIYVYLAAIDQEEKWQLINGHEVDGIVTDADINTNTCNLYISGTFGIGLLEFAHAYAYSPIRFEPHGTIMSIIYLNKYDYLIAGSLHHGLYISEDRGLTWKEPYNITNQPNMLPGSIGKIIPYIYTDTGDNSTKYLGLLLFQHTGISIAKWAISNSSNQNLALDLQFYKPYTTTLLPNYSYTADAVISKEVVCSTINLMNEERPLGSNGIALITLINFQGISTQYIIPFARDEVSNPVVATTLPANQKYSIFDPSFKPVLRAVFSADQTPKVYLFALTRTGVLTGYDQTTKTWEIISI